MNERQTRQYQKLLDVLKDPEKKSDFHNDPDIGHIVSKLSVGDVQELQQVAMSTRTCPPGGCPILA
jgi:hypothetical protein